MILALRKKKKKRQLRKEKNRIWKVYILKEESISLEEEVRQYASENKEQVTDLIRNWLSE